MTTADTQTLAAWLLAAIAEDEAAALDAMRRGGGQRWRAGISKSSDPRRSRDGFWTVGGDQWHIAEVGPQDVSKPPNEHAAANAAHIARHDPARVLAQAAAHRAIVEECEGWDAELDGRGVLADRVLRALASIYADAPGFREEWR